MEIAWLLVMISSLGDSLRCVNGEENMEVDLSVFTFVANPGRFASNSDDFVAWVPPDIPNRQALFDTLPKN